jgi:hypothetical protein
MIARSIPARDTPGLRFTAVVTGLVDGTGLVPCRQCRHGRRADKRRYPAALAQASCTSPRAVSSEQSKPASSNCS